jgi:tRNA 2-thiouridine synthesizing protein D
VNILLMVNSSPWGSTVSNTACRFLRAALAQGVEVPAVFFQGDGVYHAEPGRQTDPGAQDLHHEFARLARENQIDLMLCSAAAARRLSAGTIAELPMPYREAGLGEWLALLSRFERVVSF